MSDEQRYDDALDEAQSLRGRTPEDARHVTEILSGENLAARVQEARRLLREGDEVALLAYLTGSSPEEIRAVAYQDCT